MNEKQIPASNSSPLMPAPWKEAEKPGVWESEVEECMGVSLAFFPQWRSTASPGPTIALLGAE